ncbi:hypothetical protein Taro_010524 [Colocasia esculenta]|uniref:Nicotianamine synthase n=1 Tax=Colocasia esculenta TaxID=4460 RepID=A0A843U3L7_COLES|nr:hypothetical protein [Colocasia esculenta]
MGSQSPSPSLSFDDDVDTPALQQDERQLVSKIWAIYDSISKLPSLEPSKEVNELFSQLVLSCIPPSAIDVARLGGDAQEMRWRLIRLCGVAEGLLESHYSALLGSFPTPLDHVALFPYYNNYVQLGLLEYTILSQHAPRAPDRVAFVGSGPLPLTSIVLARDHLRSTCFHNYDLDPEANAQAQRLVAPDPDLSGRMFFHTADIMEVTHALRDYDVVFLAALVGMGAEEKARVLEHLAKYMAPGAVLMVRSAHGARAFLYPVVDPCSLRCFEVMAVHHPAGEVINSVVIARKIQSCDYQPAGHGHRILPCKCASMPIFNPLRYGNMMEEMALEEQAS